MPLDPRIAAIITAAAQKHGQDPNYLQREAVIESGGNPNARNGSSSAAGLFQFTNGTANAYGLTDKFDPAASADAAARLARDNGAYLSKQLGRDPTPGELYLAHQQGMGGAAKLLTNPGALASDVVGAKAVTGNGGSLDDTAEQFANRWISKFDGSAPSGPTMTMPDTGSGAPAASGRFGFSGIEPSAAAAPAMTAPDASSTASADAGPDYNKILASLLGSAPGQPQASAKAPAAPAMPQAPRPRAIPFDLGGFMSRLGARQTA